MQSHHGSNGLAFGELVVRLELALIVVAGFLLGGPPLLEDSLTDSPVAEHGASDADANRSSPAQRSTPEAIEHVADSNAAGEKGGGVASAPVPSEREQSNEPGHTPENSVAERESQVAEGDRAVGEIADEPLWFNVWNRQR